MAESKYNGEILALDVATVTGWCYGRPGDIPRCGHLRFGKVGGERAAAYRELRTWLTDFATVSRVKLMVYESAAIPMVMQGKTNADTIKKLIGLVEHIEEWAYGRVELREASVQQVRAHFLGSNRYKSDQAKQMTFDRCCANGWPVTTKDESDACALWSYQVACIRPDIAAKMTPLFYSNRN